MGKLEMVPKWLEKLRELLVSYWNRVDSWDLKFKEKEEKDGKLEMVPKWLEKLKELLVSYWNPVDSWDV